MWIYAIWNKHVEITCTFNQDLQIETGEAMHTEGKSDRELLNIKPILATFPFPHKWQFTERGLNWAWRLELVCMYLPLTKEGSL